MNQQLETRTATIADAHSLAPRLRRRDVESVLAAGSPGPLSSLLAGLSEGSDAFTVADDSRLPVLMFGVVPHPHEKRVGLIWALAAPEVRRCLRPLMGEAPNWITSFHRKYPVLANYLDSRSVGQRRWLSSCGFTFLSPVPGKGPGGLPFLPFYRKADELCASRYH